ncbi:hypothetical protein FIBSPDRAFT_861950 [Athelia psychrophila]|uniref:Uncharacterized protein n=1 Tax=Athelia psychrophila TaxID=1759441 RepID=A0A166ITI4_9AGAM|nr:hypothetical protein FIBSPDRAFT_861950 [Fibularhizoctonia sp. CBS 109695]
MYLMPQPSTSAPSAGASSGPHSSSRSRSPLRPRASSRSPALDALSPSAPHTVADWSTLLDLTPPKRHRDPLPL